MCDETSGDVRLYLDDKPLELDPARQAGSVQEDDDNDDECAFEMAVVDDGHGLDAERAFRCAAPQLADLPAQLEGSSLSNLPLSMLQDSLKQKMLDAKLQRIRNAGAGLWCLHAASSNGSSRSQSRSPSPPPPAPAVGDEPSEPSESAPAVSSEDGAGALAAEAEWLDPGTGCLTFKPTYMSPSVAEDALLCGAAEKRSRYFHEWRRRWLVLTPLHLCFFEKPGLDQGVPTEYISLEEVAGVGHSGTSILIKMVSASPCMFRFEDPAAAERWAECLLDTMANCSWDAPAEAA